jgi:hypothetical protein
MNKLEDGLHPKHLIILRANIAGFLVETRRMVNQHVELPAIIVLDNEKWSDKAVTSS